MKRVLIIAYYWPPSAGSGVQRWLKFAKYLPQLGWQPVIYTPENPDFSLHDESLLKEIPKEVEVIKHPIWEPYSIGRKLFGKKKDKKSSAGIVGNASLAGKLMNWLRGNLFVPDPKIYWRKPSVRFLETYLKNNPVDVIISTGTPHSMHLIGLDLKKRCNLPWIADFRDPWSELDMLKSYHIMPFIMNRYRALEQKVITSADLSVITSQVWASDLRRLGAKRVEVLTNGYDDVDFDLKVEPYKDFVISHFGLLNHLRNPSELWKALAEMCQKDASFAKRLKLHFGGTIDQGIIDEINGYPILRDKLKIFPYLSHKEVIEEYLKSSVLLLLLFNSESGKGNIPGKLFEYLAAHKPILAFGAGEGDVEKIIEENKSGIFFKYNSKPEQICKEVEDMFGEKLAVKNSSNLQYSRKELTKRLTSFLNEF